MPTATPERARRSSSKKKASSRPPKSPRPWWGDGPAPVDEWPGVSIDFPCGWSTTGKLKQATKDGRKAWINARGREIPDWERKAGGRWESLDGLFYFDTEAADRACEYFPELLRHHIGEFAGRPFKLMPYQAKLMTRPIFGWKWKKTGYRRIRKLFAFIPKGGGKSPWAAGTGLYMAGSDGEPAAEAIAVAADKNQAKVVHTNAKVMVEDSPELSEMCEITRDAIYFPASRSTFQVMSSDAGTKHGFRPHFISFDEFHAQRNRDLYEALEKSMKKRRQPLLIMISHAGDDDEGICYEEYEYAKKVLSGTISDPTYLPVIFEADSKDDWTDPKLWARVNPGHGITVQHDAIASECEAAKSEPRKLNDFLRFTLNRWVNQATAWIPVDWWDACDERMPSDEELRQYPCAVGIDMAQKIDLAAEVIGFRLPLEQDEPETAIELTSEDEVGNVTKRVLSLDFRVALVPAFFLPEVTLRERVQQDRVPYDQWAKASPPLLNVVEGAVVGANPIVRHIVGPDGKGGMLARFPRLKSAEFAYDPAFAVDVALNLRDGYGLQVVEVLQNYKHMSEVCQVFEALVKSKRIIHGGHRLLRWNMESVAVKRDDAGRIRPVKPRKPTKRVDGVVAALMAISRLMLMLNERPRKKRSLPRVWTPEGFKPVGESTSSDAHA